MDRVDHAAHFVERRRLLANEATAIVVVLKMPRGFLKRYFATGAALVFDVEIAGDVFRMRVSALHMGGAQRLT